MYGLDAASWLKDAVTARGIVYGKTTTNVALLQFNLDLGIQLELIRYKSGLFWYQHMVNAVQAPFIVHVGCHLADDEAWPLRHAKVVQEVETISHTAPHLTHGGEFAGRRYYYKIFQLNPHSFVKYIKRIHPIGGYGQAQTHTAASA
jgi:hypothetical protein